MDDRYEEASIVVGIDGSRAGVRAALWAAGEAIARDLPLHLVAVAENAAATGAAESAVKAAATAITAAGRAVAVQSAVRVGDPAPVLLEESRRAVMLCVGSIGLRHAEHTRAGTTAATLAASAHCPVAIVPGAERPAPAMGWVVAYVDPAHDSASVLQFAVEEARLRSAPLRVLGTWQSGEHGADTVAESDRVVRVQLDRRLETWRHRYPDLDVMPVAVHGSGLSYLRDNAGSIQLVVVGARNTPAVAELLGPALHDRGFTVLVVDPQRLL